MLNKIKKSIKDTPQYSGVILCVSAVIIYFLVQFIQKPAGFFGIRTFRNITSIFTSYTPLILITMGQALLMLLGIIDISIGIQLSFVNVLAVMLPVWFPIPIALAWFFAFLAGVLLSTINGLIVSYLRIPPLLESFAMIYVIKGINLSIMPKPGGAVPFLANEIYSYKVLGFLPVSLIIIALCFLVWKGLTKKPLIKNVYAVGGNERNAYASGINIERTKVKIYAIAGIYTGLAGLCYTAAFTTGNPITGEIYGLQTISACIIGGISLAGGVGNMSCALLGVGFQIFIQSTVPRIFSMISKVTGASYNTYWHNLVSDIIILIGLILTILLIQGRKETIKKGLQKQFKGLKKNEQ